MMFGVEFDGSKHRTFLSSTIFYVRKRKKIIEMYTAFEWGGVIDILNFLYVKSTKTKKLVDDKCRFARIKRE